jgi:exopolysaccharide biosynthesis protein
MTTTKHFANSRFAYSTHLVFTLCVLCALCGYSPAQDFKQLHPGVEYAQVDHKIGSDPVKINLLRLDLKKVRLDVHHALDKAIGLETTSSIATRKNAVAAINAGFFRLDKSEFAGEASDNLVIDGLLLSEGNRDRVGLEIINSNKQTVASIVRANLHPWFGSQDSRFAIKLAGVNRLPVEQEIVIFTPAFGPTTNTSAETIEIVVGGCARDKKWKNHVYCTQVSVVENSKNARIPAEGFVVSTGPVKSQSRLHLLDEIKKFQNLVAKKKAVYLRVENSLDQTTSYTESVDLVAGVPQLIKNGKIEITWEQEKASKSFVETRHPRTAVAILKDGKFLMMTVDGRQPGVSVGMSLQELAEYLFSLGAVDAMNLDGGGSTTMFLDGKVVNTPSDKEGERKVGDAIVVTLRNKKK